MTPAPRVAHAAAFLREAYALARQATLLHKDLGAVVPESGHVVIVIHGFLATAGVLRPLRDAIERDTDASVASFTHVPGATIEEVAARLGELVQQLSSAERIHLVGHSIGGLAARWFVQELGGDPRLTATTSIASPFGGAHRARLLPGRLGRQLERGSPVLERLRAGLARGSSVSHLAVAGSHDAVVREGMFPPGVDELLVAGCGHNAVVYHPLTLGAVTARIRAFSQSASERVL